MQTPMELGSQYGEWPNALSVRLFTFFRIFCRLTHPAVVIGLTPPFAVLIRVSHKPTGNTPHGHIKENGQEFQLTTIGGSGGSGNRNKKRLAESWIEMHDSQEELAGKHDAVSVSTSAHQDEESLGIAN
jgi:hypothetical protein